MCSPCIILTHTNRVGADGGGGKKQTGSINVITINCMFGEGKKCNRRKTRVIYISYLIRIRRVGGQYILSAPALVSTSSRFDVSVTACDYSTTV